MTEGRSGWLPNSCKFIALLLVLASPIRQARADEQTLQLAVELNGRSINKIGEFVSRDGVLMARRKELRDLGFQISSPAGADDNALVPLSELTGFSYQVDSATQTIRVTAANQALVPQAIVPQSSGPAPPPTPAGLGATLNYDILTTIADKLTATAGSFDARAFSAWGVFATTFLGYGENGPRGPRPATLIRLDSNYTYADPDSLRQYVVGDFVTGSLSTTRPVRFGGLQVSSNFSLRPDLVTFPLPSVGGSVAVPSTLDVLVNGNRYLSRAIDSGPFEVPKLPVLNGAGTVSLTLTDALGKQVSINLPTYASASLLAPGLSSYSAQVGAIRRNWGIFSDDYQSLAGSGTYRYGLSSNLTLEGAVEASSRVAMGGGGVVANVADLFVVQAATLTSQSASSRSAGPSSRGSGMQFSAGLQRIGRVLSVAGSATMASSGFRDLAAANGDSVERLRLSGNVGLSLGRFGSLGISYDSIVRDRLASTNTFTYVPPQFQSGSGTALFGQYENFQQPTRTSLATASYTVQIGRVSAFATAYKDFASNGHAGGLIGIALPLGGRRSLGANGGVTQEGGAAQLQIQQTALEPGDWGYQASASRDVSSHLFVDTEYRQTWGTLTAGFDRNERNNTYRFGGRGSLSYLDGGVFPSNTIQDSFAVVDTNGVGGIRILQENREVGRTNSSGKLLVPNLRSFDTNHIEVDPTDIAQDASIDATRKDIRPQYHSGVVVRFGVEASGGALLRLVDESGAPLPVGSVVRLGNGPKLPVGFEGQAYVEHLQPHNRLDVTRPDGARCTVEFDYHALKGNIPRIGPIACRKIARTSR